MTFALGFICGLLFVPIMLVLGAWISLHDQRPVRCPHSFGNWDECPKCSMDEP